jgi:predicted RNase H-like HicB family nuclease
MATYIALLRKEADSDFGVEFPDFPGCVTAGRTLEEARSMAVEALALHVAGMIEDGEAIPDPGTLDAIMSDASNREGVAILVETATEPARAVRINITLPEDLLRDIDRAAGNRSRFLADAAREKLRNAA